MDFGTFARSQTIHLLQGLAFRINAASHSHAQAAVHDLRVAIRRFSQALTIGKGCFPRREVKKMRRRLKAISSFAGEVRDCDISIKIVARSKTRDASKIESEIRARRGRAHKSLLAALRQWTTRRSFAKYRQAIEMQTTTVRPDTVETVARRKLPRLARKFFHEGRRAADPDASSAELHHLRITSKKFRYSLELFHTVYGQTGEELLEKLKDVQTALGDIHDTVCARALAQDLGASHELVTDLKKRQRRKIRQFRKAWEESLGASGAARKWTQALQRPPRKPASRERSIASHRRSAAG